MAQAISELATQRYALVTGGNKGIGFEICRQLASKGITVLLTARSEKRGIEAQEKLKEFGLSDNVVFHQLDVLESATIVAVVEFVRTKFGRLDILVNNAGVSGIELDGDVSILEEVIVRDTAPISGRETSEEVELKSSGTIIQSFEDGEECVHTNYYGAKRITEALIPLLQLSDSPRIVNVSSTLGNLKILSNEWAKKVLSDEESLTEDKVDEVVQEFLKSFREGTLEANQWPTRLSSYKVSKAALNAYTRCIAKKYPSFRINSVCPGFARTDITCNFGPLSAEEAAESPVNLALLPDGGPSGMFFYRKDLASKGITVLLTARSEKRGIEAQEKLKEFGLSDNVVFHQLDVLDPATIAAVVEFVRTKFGRLDILVNNAGVFGIELQGDVSILQEVIEKDTASLYEAAGGMSEEVELKSSGTIIQSFEDGEECVRTNYYGAKRITEALIHLLQLSDSPRIVNVSSTLGNLKILSNEWAKGVLEESLTEDKVDEVVQEFLNSFKEGTLESNQWPTRLSSYKVSKAALNGYTRCIAKKYPSFSINSVCPGFARTDITCNLGPLSAEEAAESPVNLALLPDGGPSGMFFYRKDVSIF